MSSRIERKKAKTRRGVWHTPVRATDGNSFHHEGHEEHEGRNINHPNPFVSFVVKDILINAQLIALKRGLP